MNNNVVLSDDAVIELAREGGTAWIPTLAAPRRFVLASVPAPLRQQLCAIILSAIPQATEPGQPNTPGRGDQFYYRIHISYSEPHHQADDNIIFLIPERQAPEELDALWRNGLPE